MALFFYRFRTFGLKPNHPLKIKNLYFHPIEDQKGEWVVDTIRPVKDRINTEEQLVRLLELLSVYYLKEINYYQIEERINRNYDWKWVERRSAIVAFTVKPQPFYEERDIETFLKLTFDKTDHEECIRIANTLLIAAEVETLVFEARFLLRWMALESLVNTEFPKLPLLEKQFSLVKKEWHKFAVNANSKKFNAIIPIVDEKIMDAKSDMFFRKKFDEFVNKRKLAIVGDDIRDTYKVRGSIVHTGSYKGSGYSRKECHSMSMQLRSLVRNILMHYLGLEFDTEWKKWYSRRNWRPQKRI